MSNELETNHKNHTANIAQHCSKQPMDQEDAANATGQGEGSEEEDNRPTQQVHHTVHDTLHDILHIGILHDMWHDTVYDTM